MRIQMSKPVDSVYIFVSDALRYDAISQRIKRFGHCLKTVSSSTNTCTEFPTMVTGLYPPQHGVQTFSGLINDSDPTIFDLVDGSCPCYWLPAPIRNSIDSVEHYGTLPEFFGALEKTRHPFVVMDRDNLTHLPYGHDLVSGLDEVKTQYGYDLTPPLEHDGENLTSDEYLADRGHLPERLKREYQLAAEESVRRFENRLNILRDMGLLENTLVIFTADHGEELGEYGRFTHGKTPVPETIYVPTMFYRDDAEISVEGDFMSHTDLFPTIASALDSSISANGPGYDLFEGAPDERMVFSSITIASYFGDRVEYGAWDRNGGYSFSKRIKDAPAEVGHYIRHRNYSWRQTLAVAYGEFKRRNAQFGNPGFTRSEAKTFCEQILEQRVAAGQQTLDEATKEQLQDLGYAEDTIE